jgi:hypothetical protein
MSILNLFAEGGPQAFFQYLVAPSQTKMLHLEQKPHGVGL